MEFEGKNAVGVPMVSVAVSGGRFSVAEVLVPGGGVAEGILSTIRGTPAERWFVILGDAQEGTQDLLAIVDENLEFQTMALGKLQND